MLVSCFGKANECVRRIVSQKRLAERAKVKAALYTIVSLAPSMILPVVVVLVSVVLPVLPELSVLSVSLLGVLDVEAPQPLEVQPGTWLLAGPGPQQPTTYGKVAEPT